MGLRARLRRMWPRPLRPAIIMYHRIHVSARDPWKLAVSPENFRAQLRLLSRERHILPLDEFAHLLKENALPRRAVAITFDDGYRDNLINAAPALDEVGVPATFFLATGPMRRQQGYWWDVLAAMVLEAPSSNGLVRIGSEEIQIALGPADACDLSGTWRAFQSPRTPRELLYIRLWSLIRVLPPDQIESAMAELALLFGPVASDRDAPMSVEEVRTLLSAAPASLACHTVDHPDLPAMGRELARAQILAGKAEVEALTGAKVQGFAYPYGRSNDDIVALVEEAGFTYACTSENAPVRSASPFMLPRITARDRPTIDWLTT